MCISGIVALIIVSLLLLYQDIKNREVSTSLTLLYVLLCVLVSNHTICICPLVLFIALDVYFRFVLKRIPFGEADYIVLFGSLFIMPEGLWPLFIALIGLIGIITYFIQGKKSIIPFLPAIIISTAIVNLVHYTLVVQ